MGMGIYSHPMATNYAGDSFFHLVNLLSTRRVIFSFNFWTMDGIPWGTLGQLLIPFICLLVFLIKYKNPFGASMSLWWLAESFMDIAPYINDARSQELVLLGGITEGKQIMVPMTGNLSSMR